MPRTVESQVYKLEELQDRARERALEWLAEGNTGGSYWYESVIEDAKETGNLLGILVKDVHFSGFSSQGDGACFVGTYYYKPGSVAAVKQERPTDTDLHNIARELQRIQRRNFYRLAATVTRGHLSNYYSHERTVDIETDDSLVSGDDGNTGTLAETLRDFMHWIYKRLEVEYEYCTSEEACIESADANEYEFDAEGRPA